VRVGGITGAAGSEPGVAVGGSVGDGATRDVADGVGVGIEVLVADGAAVTVTGGATGGSGDAPGGVTCSSSARLWSAIP